MDGRDGRDGLDEGKVGRNESEMMKEEEGGGAFLKENAGAGSGGLRLRETGRVSAGD